MMGLDQRDSSVLWLVRMCLSVQNHNHYTTARAYSIAKEREVKGVLSSADDGNKSEAVLFRSPTLSRSLLVLRSGISSFNLI